MPCVDMQRYCVWQHAFAAYSAEFTSYDAARLQKVPLALSQKALFTDIFFKTTDKDFVSAAFIIH